MMHILRKANILNSTQKKTLTLTKWFLWSHCGAGLVGIPTLIPWWFIPLPPLGPPNACCFLRILVHRLCGCWLRRCWWIGWCRRGCKVWWRSTGIWSLIWAFDGTCQGTMNEGCVELNVGYLPLCPPPPPSSYTVFFVCCMVEPVF